MYSIVRTPLTPNNITMFDKVTHIDTSIYFAIGHNTELLLDIWGPLDRHMPVSDAYCCPVPRLVGVPRLVARRFFRGFMSRWSIPTATTQRCRREEYT